MWKVGDKVEVTGYTKHSVTVTECKCENNRILANAQRVRFKEAKANLPEGFYLTGIDDVSRA